MSFDPRGSFNATAPLAPSILAEVRSFRSKLPHVQAGDLTRAYLHQSAEAYGCVDGAYHAVIANRNGGWGMFTSHDVRSNALSTFSADYAEATYHRNKGSVAIAIDGLSNAGASPTHFGSDPFVPIEFELLCACAAAFCSAYDIDVLGYSTGEPFGGEPNVLTHAEAANRQGNPVQYPPYGLVSGGGDGERWDLATLVQVPEGVTLTDAHAKIVGDAFRLRTHVYKAAL